ncbi:hypothetical protein [Nocardia sp. NPDC050406]|uniref:hypothetical protein n=1 Tax=Nocardia sp. NPDC050406 TaxID=3364318 RepID=UPI0037AE8526
MTAGRATPVPVAAAATHSAVVAVKAVAAIGGAVRVAKAAGAQVAPYAAEIQRVEMATDLAVRVVAATRARIGAAHGRRATIVLVAEALGGAVRVAKAAVAQAVPRVLGIRGAEMASARVGRLVVAT